MGALIDDIREVARGWRWSRRPLVPRSAEASVRGRAPRAFPTDWARTSVGRAARRVLFDYGMKPLTWWTTAPRIEGLEHLEGLAPPVLFVANHSSHVDTPLILGALPVRWRERTAVAAAADYFFDAWWRAMGTALILGTFPIERSGGPHATTTAEHLLSEGWNVVVYPEGTRSRDGWAGRFRHGAARLSLSRRVACVPIAIRGSFAAMPRGRAWPVPGRPSVSLRFGRPIHPDPGEDFRSLSRRLQQAIARLWEEDATTWWESLRREREGSTTGIRGPDAPRWRRIWESTRPLPGRTRPRVWS